VSISIHEKISSGAVFEAFYGVFPEAFSGAFPEAFSGATYSGHDLKSYPECCSNKQGKFQDITFLFPGSYTI